MTAEDLCFLTATTLASLLRSKQLSAVEVVTAHLARIERIDPKLNAVVTLMADEALKLARAADAERMRGGQVGPLHGVPFSIKDSLDVAGVPATRGSRLFKDHVPSRDATVVARLRAAGAIPLFKSNLPEFSMSYETDNAVVGASRNPWRLDRTSGGSSGGEGAAIAAGLSPLGLGSDVAISLRGPASLTGIAALKPTRIRVPITGHWPAVPGRYWHVGPMARSVADLAAVLAVLEGPDGEDVHVISGARLPPSSPDPIRVGWIAEPEFSPVAPDVVKAVEAAAEVLRSQGCAVEHVRLPFLDALSYDHTAAPVFNPEVLPYLQAAVAGREHLLSPGGRARVAQPMPAEAQIRGAERMIEELRASFAAFFRRYDILLCPTLPMTAPPVGLKEYVIRGETVPATHIMDATVPFNLAGLPAVSVPFAFDPEGLPIGVQVVADAFGDEEALQVALLIEQASRVAGRRPPL